jgi:hypothetical protein
LRSLNSEGSEVDDTPLHFSLELQVRARPPSKREILQAINKMKNGKTTGADRIPAEVLKVEPNVLQICFIHYSSIYGLKNASPVTEKRILSLRFQRRGISATVVTGGVQPSLQMSVKFVTELF